MNIESLLSFHIFNFTTLRFLDWTGVILYGTLPKTFGHEIYALFIHLIWAGTLGILFAFLIRDISVSWNLLGKGLIFGAVSGFIINAIPVLFGVQHLKFTPLKTVISNNVGGALWGLTTAFTLGWLDRRYKMVTKH